MSTCWALGFSWRKRRFLENFIEKPVRQFVSVSRLRPGDALHLWGCRPLPAQRLQGVKVVRVE